MTTRGQTQLGQSMLGQSMVESTLALLLFFTLLLGVADCAQVVFAHQALADRVQSAVRWASLHPEADPEAVRNRVLYNQSAEPNPPEPAFLGLKPENIAVSRFEPTAERPDDDTITVAIVNFETHLVSPWIARVLVSPRPVLVSAPVTGCIISVHQRPSAANSLFCP